MSVVITGVGAVSAIGSGDGFFAALESGASGITEVTTFDPGERESLLVAEIPDFAIENYLESAKTYLDRASALALAAGALAVRDAAFSRAEGRDWEAGVSLGTAFGCLGTMGTFWEGVVEKGPRLASSLLFTHSYVNTPVSLASIEFNLAGPHGCFCSGAASGAHALADAAAQIEAGRARAVLAGGLEALSPYIHAALADAGILSPGAGGPEGLRPFAASRNGTVLGEGAGMLLMESEAAASARGARVRARLLGCGMSATPEGAMRAALVEAGIAAADVDALFASASGSPQADAAEAQALESVFGSRRVPIVALKALVGETLGAGAGLAAAAAVHALESGVLPGALGAEAPEFVLNLLTAPARTAPQRVLVNAFDHRGGCVSLLLGR